MIIAASATSLVPSGTANSIQVMMACDGLRRCGADVRLCVPGTGSVSFDEVRERYALRCEPFPITRVQSRPKLHRLDFVLGALKEAERVKADVVYTWTIQIAAAAALRGKRTAYEMHDLPVGGGVRWFDLYTRTKAPKTVLFITEALRDKCLARWPKLKAEDCLIAPNGVSPEDYADLPDLAEAKRRLGFPADRTAVSCSGHLYEGRGSGLFIDLAERFPEADFHWFGGTNEAVERCRAEVSAKGLTNAVFHGFLTKAELPLAQAACDILLMPYASKIAGSSGGNSAEICSPMKMFEYMAEGRCIVSADLPVIHEVLDERCAVFCKPEDLASWTEGLRRVINDPELRNRLGSEAKRRSADYTWQKRAESYLNGSRHE